jgi:predicted nucleic acid-binding protein
VSRSAVVIDASVGVPLVMSKHASADEIASRITDRTLHAPDHLPVEVTNVLRRQRNAGLLTEAAARESLGFFWTLRIHLWPLRAVRDRVWQLGANVSANDAAYVALAEALDAPLLTADARLARAPAVNCAIELVG